MLMETMLVYYYSVSDLLVMLIPYRFDMIVQHMIS